MEVQPLLFLSFSPSHQAGTSGELLFDHVWCLSEWVRYHFSQLQQIISWYSKSSNSASDWYFDSQCLMAFSYRFVPPIVTHRFRNSQQIGLETPTNQPPPFFAKELKHEASVRILGPEIWSIDLAKWERMHHWKCSLKPPWLLQLVIT